MSGEELAQAVATGMEAVRRIERELRSVSAALDAIERAGANAGDAGMLERCRDAVTVADDEIGLLHGYLTRRHGTVTTG